jgi:hypothetical protein
VVAGGPRGGHERRERVDVAPREYRPLLLGPAREVVGAGDRDAVEERAAVVRDRRRGVARGERRLERRRVHEDARRVEGDADRDRHEGAVGEGTAQRREGHVEGVAGLVGRLVGPEEGEQPVAAHPARPGARDRGEEGQPLPLDRRAGGGRVAALEAQSTEHVEPCGLAHGGGGGG